MSRIPFLVKKVREALGLTQEAFARKIGKTRNDVAKYERGYAVPPGDVMLKILDLEPKPE